MKQHDLTVHCIYIDGEKKLTQLLEDSFRSYLLRILATPVKKSI